MKSVSAYIERLKQAKQDLREMQVNLSLEEKIKMLDRLQNHYLWVLEHPMKILPKEK